MMIRWITSAVLLAGLVAASGGLYASGQSAWSNVIAGWLGSSEPQVKLAAETWPICTSMGAIAAHADGAEFDPDFAAGKNALAVGDWNGAIASLKLASLRDPRNADIQNYIGYAYRRLRQLGPAMGHYQRALMFNPRHRSVHQHIGELYLVLHEPTKAEEHRAALERICLVPCEELGDLVRVIAAYKSSAAR